jgi:hypothetical protein
MRDCQKERKDFSGEMTCRNCKFQPYMSSNSNEIVKLVICLVIVPEVKDVEIAGTPPPPSQPSREQLI